MPYQVSRGGQIYGPYTLEDLQRYLASGNVLLTDLAKSEEMADWVPVSQIVSPPTGAPPVGIPAPGAIPVPGAAIPTPPAYVPASGAVNPDPPNLHWALVLVFGILTCGLFFVIWDFVQVLWVKRVQPQTQAMLFFILYVVFWLLNTGSSLGRTALILHGNMPQHFSPLSAITSLATLIFVIVYRFAMRSSLEQHFNVTDPVGLRLGPVMTFFFGGLYFQYHFNRINEIKQAARYRGY